MTQKCRLLIVDDSALMRQLLTQIFSTDPTIEIVGSASDPFVAREKIKALHPDVITLDIEMPRMDGLTFLEKLMRAHPMPVVMISSLTVNGAETTLRALNLGAIDYIPKPRLDIANRTLELADEIVARVKTAARAKVQTALRNPAQAPLRPLSTNTHFVNKVVAIGASTGGTEALCEILTALPANFPGVVIVQHMPEAFTAKFAERLNTLCAIEVKEAKDGDRILPGRALLAPGGKQMSIQQRSGGAFVHVYAGEKVNRHAPSVDVLFSSCARSIGREAMGVILTGMGADGSRGLLEMHQAKAYTIAQDESTSVVFGMPKEAIALGGVDSVLPLGHIASTLIQSLKQKEKALG